jgi:hypothetical protein
MARGWFAATPQQIFASNGRQPHWFDMQGACKSNSRSGLGWPHCCARGVTSPQAPEGLVGRPLQLALEAAGGGACCRRCLRSPRKLQGRQARPACGHLLASAHGLQLEAWQQLAPCPAGPGRDRGTVQQGVERGGRCSSSSAGSGLLRQLLLLGPPLRDGCRQVSHGAEGLEAVHPELVACAGRPSAYAGWTGVCHGAARKRARRSSRAHHSALIDQAPSNQQSTRRRAAVAHSCRAG